VERTGIDPQRIDDVVMAQSYANSETPAVGRWAALHAGLPVTVPGMQLDRRCGGGLQAVGMAAMLVQTGVCDVVVAAGVESMSNIEYYSTAVRWGMGPKGGALHDRLDRGRARSQPEWRFGAISGMVETAENLADDYAIGRSEADAYAVESHRRAHAAWLEGRFDDEVVPVQGDGEDLLSTDEGIRPETDLDRLARLRPVLPSGVVTAGNASQQNDAAAACLVVAEHRLEDLGLEPAAYVVDWVAVGCEPNRMGIGPVPAVAKIFARTGLGFADMDLVELNEAFAVQVLAVLKAWDWHDPDKLNVNGGAISLGHPIAATGVRLMTTLLHELGRRQGRFGLETMCIGGGQGMAAIFERAA
jgi:acetyl-CoA C-acetyltransferase